MKAGAVRESGARATGWFLGGANKDAANIGLFKLDLQVATSIGEANQIKDSAASLKVDTGGSADVLQQRNGEYTTVVAVANLGRQPRQGNQGCKGRAAALMLAQLHLGRDLDLLLHPLCCVDF